VVVSLFLLILIQELGWDRTYLVRVGHFPGAAQSAIVVAHTSTHGLYFSLFRVEGVTVVVLFTTHGCLRCHSIGDEDRVGRAIDIRIDSQTEEMLVVVSIDARINLSAPWSCRLAGVQGISVQDTCQLDLELDRAVLVEDPVDAVLVVCCGENVAD
jgi:hypothetical protein